MEVRTLKDFTRSLPFELSDDGDDTGDGRTFSGYAAVFNQTTRISSMWEGDFDETISPGAFADSLRTTTPVFQFDHGQHPLIGSIPLGTITRAEEDDKGVFVTARLSDNWLIEPVRDAIRDKAINGMSFRFTVPDGGETWVETSGQVPQRTLTKVDCRELGPVVFPAYQGTSAAVRSKALHLLGIDVGTGQSSARSTDDGLELEIKKLAAIRERDDLRLKGILR